MRILVSNDDGIYSPGIACLARVAARFGEVRVVAPDVEQPSASHAVTASRPLTYRPTPQLGDVEAYRVNGTPADCVALGVYNWKDVDLVLSGINLGVNMGNGIWHSGTLAAAKQATLFGIRGIAFSTPVRGIEPTSPPWSCTWSACWTRSWPMTRRASSTSTCRSHRRAWPGPGRRSATTTARLSRTRTPWAGSSSGSRGPDRGDGTGHRPVGLQSWLHLDDAAHAGSDGVRPATPAARGQAH